MNTPSEDNWPTFLCSYQYKGSRWSFHLIAEDRADAEARIEALYFAQVDGPLIDSIPVNSKSKFAILKAAIAVRNFIVSFLRE